MDKTTGYCLKTIGCTQKSGFLFAGTRCKWKLIFDKKKNKLELKNTQRKTGLIYELRKVQAKEFYVVLRELFLVYVFESSSHFDGLNKHRKIHVSDTCP